VLDAGAFIALERSAGHVVKLLARLVRANIPLVTSGGVVAQIWRGGAGRQAPVAMLLHQVEVIALDGNEGKVIGMVLGESGTRDPVDGHVVLLARERSWPVLTSDREDLLAIDPGVEVLEA
jgi:hypothetical protein